MVPCFSSWQGSLQLPYAGGASYPFVYLPERNTPLCELFLSDKSEKKIPYFEAVSLSKRFAVFCFCGCKNRPAVVPYAKGKFLSPYGKTPAASVLEAKEKLRGVWQFCIFQWCREQRETRTEKTSVS